MEKALGVYDTLLAADPDNREMADRAAAVRARLADEGIGPPVDHEAETADTPKSSPDPEADEPPSPGAKSHG